MKKLLLFTIVLSLSSCVMAQNILSESRLNTIWGTGQVPRGVNNTDTWYTLKNGGWQLTGNTAGNTTSFIGTIDNNPFSLKTNNVTRLSITNSGTVIVPAMTGDAFPYFSTSKRLKSTALMYDSTNLSIFMNGNTNITNDDGNINIQLQGTSLGGDDEMLINSSDRIDITATSTNITSNFNVTGGSVFTGSVTVKDGSQGVGKIAVSDANGVLTWITPSAGEYTPTFSTRVNIDSVYKNMNVMYSKSGDVVTAQYSIYIDATAAASTVTSVHITLPITSNPSAALAGQGVANGAGAVCIPFLVTPVDSQHILVSYLSGSTAIQLLNFSITYRAN